MGHLHAAALTANPKSYFAAVLGRTESKAKAFADQYGVKAYTNLDTFLKESDVEAVSICTPHRDPCVSGVEGRQTVELFTAIYRSGRDRVVITYP